MRSTWQWDGHTPSPLLHVVMPNALSAPEKVSGVGDSELLCCVDAAVSCMRHAVDPLHGLLQLACPLHALSAAPSPAFECRCTLPALTFFPSQVGSSFP